MDISPIKSRNIWAHITDKEPGIISMPLADDNFSSWGAGSAYIDTINVQTTSTDWDLYVYNKYKYSTNTEGLIGYWKLEEDKLDSSNNGNTLTNGAITYDTGKLGMAGSFNGSISAWGAPQSSLNNLSKSITMSAWIYPKTSASQYIIAKNISNYSADNMDFSMGMNGASNLLECYINGTHGLFSTTIETYKWTHLTLTWDGTTAIYYINGLYAEEKSLSATIQNVGTWINIGRRSASVDGATGAIFFNGLIDEVKIYDRVLSSTEIQEEYESLGYINYNDIDNVTKVASNLSGNQILHPNLIYNNDTKDQITLLYVSNSGNETCSLYVKGELREKNINTDRTSYWNQNKTSTYTTNLAKSYFEYLPRNMYIIAENLSSTVYMLPRETDPASWHGRCSFISTIKISTASKDYDIYLYENEEYDDDAITTIKIAENLSMDNEIELNAQYKSLANFVYLKIVDNDGANTFNLYISGESREIQDTPVGQKQKIIIDYSKVTNTDQEDFPVLIKISQADNPVFLYADDDGENIYFSSIDNTLEYPAEIEIFSKTEKLLIAWVKVPVVSASSNTEFYMHYLNSTRKRESNPEDVWDSNFAGVWHLNDETTSSVLDSTSNDNDMGKIATNEPIETDGKILKAQQFDQSNDRIYKHSLTPDSLTMTTAFTLSAWIYPFTTENTATQYIIMRNSSSTTGAQYSLHRNNGTTTVGRISAYVHGTAKDLGTSDLPVNNWYHVVVTFSKPTLNSYINGAYLGTGSYDSPVVGSGDFINIGGRSNSSLGDVGAFVFHGNIDEARVSNIARSADWIATEYNNQNDPDSFYSIIIE